MYQDSFPYLCVFSFQTVSNNLFSVVNHLIDLPISHFLIQAQNDSLVKGMLALLPFLFDYQIKMAFLILLTFVLFCFVFCLNFIEWDPLIPSVLL